VQLLYHTKSDGFLLYPLESGSCNLLITPLELHSPPEDSGEPASLNNKTKKEFQQGIGSVKQILITGNNFGLQSGHVKPASATFATFLT
jgi:hypothetical protein